MAIGDLGLAKINDQIKSTTKFAGTINYISPECILNEKITIKSDIWSFGCILYELVELDKAFTGSSEYEIMKKIVKGDVNEIKKPCLNLILLK